jgi:hypothetical protein
MRNHKTVIAITVGIITIMKYVAIHPYRFSLNRTNKIHGRNKTTRLISEKSSIANSLSLFKEIMVINKLKFTS